VLPQFPRASLVILLQPLNTFVPEGLGPIGVAIIFGRGRADGHGPTCVNVIGNCLGRRSVVARWGKKNSTRIARAVFGTPQEAELDLNPATSLSPMAGETRPIKIRTSALPGVRANGMTSRMFETPVRT